MKLFKKLSIALICALCVFGMCFSLTACSGGESVAEGTYVFYVYLDDGETPVEGAQLSICYNISETSSTCYPTPATTDSTGRAEIDLSSLSEYNSLNPNGFCVHFNTLMDTPVGFPDGYTYPANSQKIILNDNSTYEIAWYMTSQISTFKLVKE